MSIQLETTLNSGHNYDIFQFVKNANVELKDFEKSKINTIKKFITNKIKTIDCLAQEEKNEVLNDFKNINFYDLKIYKRQGMTDEDFVNFMILCSNIQGEIYEAVCPEYKHKIAEIEQAGVLERQVSPPLSAYKPGPFNKTDITNSDTIYGYLFE